MTSFLSSSLVMSTGFPSIFLAAKYLMPGRQVLIRLLVSVKLSVTSMLMQRVRRAASFCSICFFVMLEMKMIEPSNSN